MSIVEDKNDSLSYAHGEKLLPCETEANRLMEMGDHEPSILPKANAVVRIITYKWSQQQCGLSRSFEIYTSKNKLLLY